MRATAFESTTISPGAATGGGTPWTGCDRPAIRSPHQTALAEASPHTISVMPRDHHMFCEFVTIE